MTFHSVLLRESFNVCGVPSHADWLVCDSALGVGGIAVNKRDKVFALAELAFQDCDRGERQQTNEGNSS